MPELPEVEAVVRALREDGLAGARLGALAVHREAILRPQSADEFAERTRGRRVKGVNRRAKNILIALDSGDVIRVHLRMTGDLRIVADPREEVAAARLEWRLGRSRRLVYADARALGRIHVLAAEEAAQIGRALGPEPLDGTFTAEQFAERARASRLAAKLFLMDQRKIAGLGNIYAAEALFRAKISPQKAMNTIGAERLRRLHTVIREMLGSAVQSVYSAYRSRGGYRNHQDDFPRAVYGRAGEPCVVCRAIIRRMEQGGRSTYYCGRCQR